MHLFLYKASRHEKPKSFYGSRRLVQGTYRNDFDLELIKSGIKGRYTILPHGSNPFQARLRDFGLEDEFYGHIIEVPEAKNAIWFKLNYDNIGKPGTNYIGSWKNLDVEYLRQFDLEFQELQQNHSKATQVLNQVRYHTGTLNHFLSNRHNYSAHMDDALDKGAQYKIELEAAYQSIHQDILALNASMEAIRQKIRDYMKSHAL